MTEFEEEYTEFHDENNNRYANGIGYHKALIRHFKDWHSPEHIEKEIEVRTSRLELNNQSLRIDVSVELEKVKKQRDSLKEAIEHAIATMAHDGRHDNIPISWILPKLITSLAALEGSGDESC